MSLLALLIVGTAIAIATIIPIIAAPVAIKERILTLRVQILIKMNVDNEWMNEWIKKRKPFFLLGNNFNFINIEMNSSCTQSWWWLKYRGKILVKMKWIFVDNFSLK
mgnify:CR=1 FL=1